MKNDKRTVDEKMINIKRNEELLNKLHTIGIIDDNGNIAARK